ncbi:ABC transporter permease [Geodermatophilus ruber]|uniref:ABC-2 family transporter protein n=1 Tax=Geodermatophilus ruber TaxID=504800 RepID=A0A1I4G9Y1_9ACTN|nr:ABC transporter permease [Geodermatophilus ruber]SFL25941.1 ABC-2 family transporter protein [Geodermatophilus ruber]
MSVAVPARALLRSEWTKLRSVRSTWWCTAVYLVTVGAFGWLAAATTPTAIRADVAVSVALTGFGFGQLVIVVLGVLAVSAEFGTGTALVSLTAVPRRTRLLMVKTAVVATWTALLTAALAAVCALAARTLTAVPGGFLLTGEGVLRPLGLQVAGAVLVAVLAVGLGAVLRSTAGGVGAGVALVFLLPPLLALSGSELAARASQALPALRVGEDPFLAVPTSWPVGLVVTGAWALGTWAMGAVLLERRDV